MHLASFDRMECYAVFMAGGDNGLSISDQEWTATGADAWSGRWWLLKIKLGLNPDKWP